MGKAVEIASREMKEYSERMIRLRDMLISLVLNEIQSGEIPKLHIGLDYSVRPFQEVESEYLELFYRFSEEKR